MQIAVIVQGHECCRHHSSFLLGIAIWMITLKMLLRFGHLSKQRSKWVTGEWQAAFDLNIQPMSFYHFSQTYGKNSLLEGHKPKVLQLNLDVVLLNEP